MPDTPPSLARSNVFRLYAGAPAPRALVRPLVEGLRCAAGFPSPAADYAEEALDLNELMVRNPPATFYVRVDGDSMIDAGIFDRDILVVDRSIDPVPGRIVVAAVDGERFVKRLGVVGGRPALCSENRQRPEYRPLFLDTCQDCTIWGVVTGAIRRF
jgi:DNA polymerase V